MQKDKDEETLPIVEGKEEWCVCMCVRAREIVGVYNVQYPHPDISCSLSSITVGCKAHEASREGSKVLGVGGQLCFLVKASRRAQETNSSC